MEASGTSGMKAAHNGVPSFSVLDGWWIEGHIEGITGWSIGPKEAGPGHADSVNAQDALDLYRKLHALIAPMFYNERDRWLAVMQQAIAFNASFFNTHRMVQQYAANAYV
jgi:starch phosphorylase